MVVYDKKYSDTEYMDTITMSQAKPVEAENFHEEIVRAVEMMILGPSLNGHAGFS